MAYVKAIEVISPVERLQLVRVLHDPGPTTDKSGVYMHSWAIGMWKGIKDKNYRPVILSRWNGDNHELPKGNPTSTGHATWFVHDDASYPFLLDYLAKIAPDQVDFVRDFLGLRKAA